MDQKLLYKVHKWLALVVAVATLAWFASGALMAVPGRFLTLTPSVETDSRAEARLPGSPEFDAARISAAEAIASIRADIGKPFVVTGVTLRRLAGRLAYEVSTDIRGQHLVDAVSGSRFTIDEALARQIVARFRGTDEGLGPAVRQVGPTSGYTGPLPAFRVPVGGAKGTVFYVSAETAQTRMSDRLSRPLGAIARQHNLSFLRPVLSLNGIRLVMILMASIGTVMTASGILILIVQFRRWLRMRLARPSA